MLAGGGVGVVYRAIDYTAATIGGAQVSAPALSHDVTANERFMAEAQAASALDHANICTVHEFGESDAGQLFIAMAYYDGESLRTKFEGGALPKDKAVD